ncbi:MAG: nucleotidyltransferase family protein [Clostridiales Family XIII bacterium]|jgi:predicted nucleotidyltransferase|nr:nucleotidyltransferase family protein [Clostridiales Family XIII bacterium]
MKTLGVIAEYDPFHNGHLHHLRESLRLTGADKSVCVMSGDFLQRGGPALTDKRMRAEAAVRGGIDLVIELPFVYASGGAEQFARGAVGILDGLGLVDYLAFGSESGEIAGLQKIAGLFVNDSEIVNALIHDAMKTGISYPAALEKAVVSKLGAAVGRHMKGANNTLAIEYLKELLRLESGITPITIKRHKASLNEIDKESGIAGATAIRELLLNHTYCSPELSLRGAKRRGNPHDEATNHSINDIDSIKPYVPESTFKLLSGYLQSGGRFLSIDDLLPMLAYAISSSDPEQLSHILSATEGLEHRLIGAVRRGGDMADIIRLSKTKRYTLTRIRRLITHTVTGLTKEAMTAAAAEPLYARVLAFNEQGAKLIRLIKKKGKVPVITNANRETELLADSAATFSYDQKAADLHRILEYGALNGFDDLKIPPVAVTAPLSLRA